MITGQPERGFIERSRAGSQVVLAYVLQRKLPGQGNKKGGGWSPFGGAWVCSGWWQESQGKSWAPQKATGAHSYNTVGVETSSSRWFLVKSLSLDGMRIVMVVWHNLLKNCIMFLDTS